MYKWKWLYKISTKITGAAYFYPVLNEKYATEIAAQWNVKYNDDYKGYVTKFEIDDEYFLQFEVHVVGGEYHQELWVLAEESN